MHRTLAGIFAVLAISGCAGYSDRQSLGYGDYVAYSCDQLGQEAIRLMRQAANRSEHLLADDKAQRDLALRQLSAVKRASAEKRC